LHFRIEDEDRLGIGPAAHTVEYEHDYDKRYGRDVGRLVPEGTIALLQFPFSTESWLRCGALPFEHEQEQEHEHEHKHYFATAFS
jgi:hypothetical protein